MHWTLLFNMERTYAQVRFNKDQCNLTKGGVAVASSPKSSFVFARWQHRTDGLAAICNSMYWLGVRPQISPSPGGQGPHLTQCVIVPHKCSCQMASKSVERFKQGARMWQTTDRQTDHATEKCVWIGGVACAARVMLWSLVAYATEMTQNWNTVQRDKSKTIKFCLISVPSQM